MNIKQAPAPAPKVTDEMSPIKSIAWDKVCECCAALGKPDEQTIADFIRSLAQRAGEGYTIREINQYLESLKSEVRQGSYNVAIEYARTTLNDERFGIKSVTTRADTRPERKDEE